MAVKKTEPTLRVMVIDDNEQRLSSVVDGVTRAGYDVCGGTPFHMGILKIISQESPDVILIEMDSPGRDLLESLSLVSAHQPTPIVMATQEHDPDYMTAAVNAGVSTYLLGALAVDQVSPIIDVAMAQFKAFQALKSELAKTRSELDERRLVNRATSFISDDQNLSESAAYQLLRNHAMSCRRSIAEVAQEILDSTERSHRKP